MATDNDNTTMTRAERAAANRAAHAAKRAALEEAWAEEAAAKRRAREERRAANRRAWWARQHMAVPLTIAEAAAAPAPTAVNADLLDPVAPADGTPDAIAAAYDNHGAAGLHEDPAALKPSQIAGRRAGVQWMEAGDVHGGKIIESAAGGFWRVVAEDGNEYYVEPTGYRLTMPAMCGGEEIELPSLAAAADLIDLAADTVKNEARAAGMFEPGMWLNLDEARTLHIEQVDGDKVRYRIARAAYVAPGIDLSKSLHSGAIISYDRPVHVDEEPGKLTTTRAVYDTGVPSLLFTAAATMYRPARFDRYEINQFHRAGDGARPVAA